MGFYLLWPYFVGTIFILALAATPLLRLADQPPTIVPARVQTIDGLRGFLALGVFFHHATIYHQYLLTGKWALPPVRFYANLGQVSVAMFFMITGYLFWTKMLKAQGKSDFLKLYIGRVFRIVPLTLLLAGFVLLSVGVLTKWRLEEPPLELAGDVSRWLSGGVFLGSNVNAMNTSAISAGVTWSLQYEWMYYASLLITSLFARHIILGIVLPIVGMVIVAAFLLRHPSQMSFACPLMFFVGMTVASAKRSFGSRTLEMPQWIVSTGAIGCLALVLLGFDGIYRPAPILILGIAFGLIASGGTVYGLLLTRSAKRLGDVSYGIYLLQGPMLFLAFAPALVRSWATASAWGHWTVVMMAAVALVLLAALAHSLIERPGIQVGHRMYASLISLR